MNLKKKIGGGIAVAGLALASTMIVPSLTASAATGVSGRVQCMSGDWVSAQSGGSGWASWTADSTINSVATYSFTLPNGGSYHLNVGCGGTPSNWARSLSTPQVTQTTYNFNCYDTIPPYSCQIA